MDLEIDGLLTFERRSDLAGYIAEAVRRAGCLVAKVESLSNQQLADVCWAAQLAGGQLSTPLSTRTLRDERDRAIEIHVAPRAQRSRA